MGFVNFFWTAVIPNESEEIDNCYAYMEMFTDSYIQIVDIYGGGRISSIENKILEIAGKKIFYNYILFSGTGHFESHNYFYFPTNQVPKELHQSLHWNASPCANTSGI